MPGSPSLLHRNGLSAEKVSSNENKTNLSGGVAFIPNWREREERRKRRRKSRKNKREGREREKREGEEEKGKKRERRGRERDKETESYRDRVRVFPVLASRASY